PAPRGPHPRSSVPLTVQRAELGELPLEQRAESGHVRLELALHVRALALDLALRGARAVEDPLRFRLGLAHDHLRLPPRPRARLLARLVGRLQRLLQCAPADSTATVPTRLTLPQPAAAAP